MDKLLGEIVWLALFGAGCYVITLGIRKIVETAQPHLKEKPYKTTFSRWWNQVFLYLIPITIGGCVGAALKGTSVLPSGIESYQVAVVYGMVIGSLSSMLYKILKMLILKKAGLKSEEELTTATNPTEKNE